MRHVLVLGLIVTVAVAALVARAGLEPAGATGPDTWTSTGSMTDGRYQPAASRLADGRVLVTGGRGAVQGFSVNTTEIYDPASNVWAPAPSMAAARSRHQQVTLPDGRVLVACGEDIGMSGIDPVAAERYNPATASWSAAGALAQPRPGCRAVLLPSGKVLVIGGGDSDTGVWPLAVEIYDPALNSWSQGAPMTAARAGHVAVLLADGRVLVAGGLHNGAPVVSVEVYDPVADMWSSAGPMGRSRYEPAAVRLPDGRVLVAAGYDGNYTNTAEFYDPATNAWSAAPSLPFGRTGAAMVMLPNGLALLAGGHNPNFGYLKDTVLFNPAANAWSTVADMNVGRGSHVIVALADGRVLAAASEDSPANATAEVYEAGSIPPPDTPTNTPTATVPPPNTFTPTPTLVPASPTPTPTACSACPTPTPTNTAAGTPTTTPQTLPDLIVASIENRQTFGGCPTPAGLRIVVQNFTSIGAGASSLFVQAVTGASETVPVPAITGGSSVTVFSSVTGIPIGDTYTATADSALVVAESNETNNSLSASLSLSTLPTCTPTITPTSTSTFTPTPTATSTPCSAPDNDGDGVPDCVDNCPATSNPDQLNNDGNFIDHSPPYNPTVDDRTRAMSDALGDACDPDDDSDGLPDGDELNAQGTCLGYLTNPLSADSDNDRVLDLAECTAHNAGLPGDPNNASIHPYAECAGLVGNSDADGDRVVDYLEYCYYGTDRFTADSDGDGTKDGCEIRSFNHDRIVNVADMGMLAVAIANTGMRHVNVDVNKDGVWNPADQGLVASFISPSGQCP